MERLVKIWEERAVFDKDFINALKKTFLKGQQRSTESAEKGEQMENFNLPVQ